MDRKASWLSFRSSFISADSVAGVALVMMVAACGADAPGPSHPGAAGLGGNPSECSPVGDATGQRLGGACGATRQSGRPTLTPRTAVAASTRPRATARPSVAATATPTLIVSLPISDSKDPEPTPSIKP